MTSLRSAVCAIGLLLSAQERDTLKVDVQLAQVVVTVTDTEGRYITNLNPEDFTVEFDGVPQNIEHFTRDVDTPVSIGILIDVSLSMRGRLEAARLAGSRFIHAMRPADEFFLTTFAARPHTEQAFTQDRARLDKALENLGGPMSRFVVGMGTNLFSAVAKGAEMEHKAKYRKRALIVISDGGNNSAEAFKDFRASLRNSEILMYAVQIQDVQKRFGPIVEPGAGYSTLVMRTVAEDTGGRWFGVGAHEASSELIAQFDDAFTQISAELRGQYSIGFYPSAKGVASAARIRVKTSNPAYKVRFR